MRTLSLGDLAERWGEPVHRIVDAIDASLMLERRHGIPGPNPDRPPVVYRQGGQVPASRPDGTAPV